MSFQEFAVFDFGFVKIHDVAITPDDKRILAVGPVLQSPSGLKPSRSRSEKRLIVFNTELQQIEWYVVSSGSKNAHVEDLEISQVPVLNDVRSITLVEMHRGALVALISYENKAPPQLWKLEIIKGNDVSRESSRLTLRCALIFFPTWPSLINCRHTYVPENTVDFAGPSYFGGHNHELVLCAGKSELLTCLLQFIRVLTLYKRETFLFGGQSLELCYVTFFRKLIVET